MEDDSFLHKSRDLHFPIKGMESVVATVSGYQGSERFSLIKLISQTGASYVGSMNQSVTHLVCWKFEGRKYDLGKKFKTVIVNHCWIEECIKKGRRVPEHPYTFQCGEEMGPLLDMPLGFNKAGSQSKPWNHAMQHVIDIESEDTDEAFVIDTSLLNEERQNNHGSKRPKRKTVKRSYRRDYSDINSNYLNKLLLSGPMMAEPEEPSSSKQALSLKKGKSTSFERCRDRRLVKKHRSLEDLGFAGDFGQDCQPAQVFLENNSSGASHNNSDKRGDDEFGNASDQTCFWSRQINNEALDGVEEIEDMNDDDNQNLCVEDAPSSVRRTGDDCCTAVHEVLDDNDLSTKLHQSTELSCVICWTDFSSTRGVLPCGHRFCFSCIQTWADHMVSRGKASTCPLCKSSFVSITKVEDAVSSDQKIYSQTIPHDRSKIDAYILLDEVHTRPAYLTPVCCQCFSREPEDLLIRCQLCQSQCVHSYCLDPPLFPWTCVHCKDLQMLYLQSR
ncbi:zinc finger (C3HC4-type RING finger) family protein/BRCT domain-containing protein [Abeliophyllum distichum]|uniref:Zinc finger (C3HC4-type RING finger) family protein/BRCT domain-containing protein n=1 Tax=Abeliophyllum distichum TaxID=126358 RepID=A0ABD1SS99_9LAMI